MVNPRLADHVFMYRLTPHKLDRLLAAGYFRNTNIMFQSQVLCLDGRLCDVVNVRLPLETYLPPKKIAKIASKVEQQFRITTGKATITPQKEALYYLHRQRFKGFQFKGLHQMLYGDSPVRIFDTYEICIYDGDQLIAYSFFDVGNKSIASILGVFDDRYKKYSLGIYTMYAEIKQALAAGFQYYYPGYVLDGVPQFDYKLSLGEHEYFLWNEKRWIVKAELSAVEKAGERLTKGLGKIASLLERAEIAYEYRLYPFFSLGYLSLSNYQFYVRSPMHLLLPELSGKDKFILLEYDTDTGRYVCGTARVNEAYQEYIKNYGGMQRAIHIHEWPTVLEYHAMVEHNSPESLVRDILQNYL